MVCANAKPIFAFAHGIVLSLGGTLRIVIVPR
jgi:hypothetical protein